VFLALERLIVKSAGRVSFLRTGEIDWIEAADNDACLHVAGKTHLVRRSMSELERDQDPAALLLSVFIGVPSVAGSFSQPYRHSPMGL
jgi:DNA-binding LytR/AlgR family response regulator